MLPRHVGGRYPTPGHGGFVTGLEIWSGRGDSNSRSRAPEARAFNQARPLPEIWWLVTELNPVHRCFRPALCRRVHEPKSLVDGASLDSAFHVCMACVIPLYEPPTKMFWGEMRESNSRNWSHNPAPEPFGQSRHQDLELVE